MNAFSRSVRRFATSTIKSASFFARTTVAPTGLPITLPHGIDCKSVLLLATPQNLVATIESAISLHRDEKLQVIVAGVERIVPNGESNGISELWMDARMEIKDPILLSEEDKPEPLRASDGVHPVGAKVNWKQVDATLNLNVLDFDIAMKLANTAFYTNLLSTLFYLEPEQKDDIYSHSGETLCGLLATLPDLEPLFGTACIYDNWTSLTASDEPLVVTKCTGNLLKGINKKPASLYLEQNEKLLSISSRETKVYVKITEKNGTTRRYEVIAGGGGWGAKADLLAISPDAKLQVGDHVEFFMVAPKDQGKMRTGVISNQFLFECAPEAKSYDESRQSTQTIDNLFGCGSESGFVVSGVNHKSPGESLSLPF